tara:strand:+ start:38 stop:436 length:399 start_codon:yes stop_codon:yes gene_type:complete
MLLTLRYLPFNPTLLMYRYVKQKHKQLDNELAQLGKEILTQALNLDSAADSASTNSDHVRVIFQQVEITGFGSFGPQMERYLFVTKDGGTQGRGLVLIDGRLLDGGVEVEGHGGIKSNGAGKTTLVMSALWA